MRRIIQKGVVTTFAAITLMMAAPLLVSAAEDKIEINETNFPDYNFRESFVRYYDNDEDGYLSQEEIAEVTQIGGGERFADYTGMEYFTEATAFRSMSSTQVTSIDFSKNPKIEDITLYNSGISEIDLSKNTELKSLSLVGASKLTSLDLSHNPKLNSLTVRDNALEKLDLSDHTQLTYVDCSGNQIGELNVSNCTALVTLDCAKNKLSGDYDLTGLQALEEIRFYKNDGARVKVDGLQKLNSYAVSDTGLTALSISDCPALTNISCYNNSIASLTIQNCGALTNLECENNRLANLDGVEAPALQYLKVQENQLTSGDYSRYPKLYYLDCSGNQLEFLDLSLNSKLDELNCNQNRLTAINITSESLRQFYCVDNPITTLNINTEHSCYIQCEGGNLTNLDGLNTPNLIYLHVADNQIEELDLSKYPKLSILDCSNNRLKTLNPGSCPELFVLKCGGNQLTALDVSANKDIRYGYIEGDTQGSYSVQARDNSYLIETDAKNQFDLSQLEEISGFDIARAGDWEGGTVDGKLLTVNAGASKVTYSYILKEFTEEEDKAPIKETFTLKLDGVCEHPNVSGWKNDGTNHYKQCLDCKVILEKKPHTTEVYQTKASVNKDGKRMTTCTVCNTVLSTELIPGISKVSLSATNYIYDGKEKRPTVTVTDRLGKTVSPSAYTVTYSSGRIDTGAYTVTVMFKGTYEGSVTKSFTISPKILSLNKLTAGKKKLVVKWKKQTKQISGYQIQYSTDKKFKKSTKQTTAKANASSKTIKKLKSKKKYYVRIRSYKTVTVDGKKQKLYSSWSRSKSIKVK